MHTHPNIYPSISLGFHWMQGICFLTLSSLRYANTRPTTEAGAGAQQVEVQRGPWAMKRGARGAGRGGLPYPILWPNYWVPLAKKRKHAKPQACDPMLAHTAKAVPHDHASTLARRAKFSHALVWPLELGLRTHSSVRPLEWSVMHKRGIL